MESIRKLKTILGIQPPPREIRELKLYGSVETKFCSNVVKTSRYNIVSFIPMNLFLQFTKPANIYFLIIAILQVIPSISLSGSMPTTAIPLAIVVIANMVKDAIEDYNRHRSDEKENSQFVQVLNSAQGTLEKRKWKDIKVGDVIALENYQSCPSDIVLLGSSEQSGVSFIETSNLDGETNLKLKTVPREFETLGLSGLDSAASAAGRLCSELKEARIKCQLPNNQLYQFEGSMQLDGKNGDEESGTGSWFSLGPNNVILRGCMLRNTEWILGVAVYTGHETKIQMNSRAAPRKLSSLELLTGKFIWIAFWIQLVLCTVGALVWGLLVSSWTFQSKLYLSLSDLTSSEIAGKAVLKFFSYMILFSNFIPISLTVTMAIVKLLQSKLIESDSLMEKSAVVRSSDLNEELGQIEFVFTDKTGTLTCNKMEFRKLCVSGISYGRGLTEIRRNVLKKLGEPIPVEEDEIDEKNSTPNVNLVDEKLHVVLRDQSPSDHYRDLVMFFFSLAANHSVMIESSSAYSASSPDEGALCYGAKHFGFAFQDRDQKSVLVQLPDGHKVVVEQLASFDFDSSRKRSSLVCKCHDPRDWLVGSKKVSKYFVLIKGADSVMVPRVVDRPSNAKMLDVMEEYAMDGLRTLCIGYRELSKEFAQDWVRRFKEASASLKDREQKLESLATEVETQIELLGVSAIEDKLQKNVGETIDSLRNAGMKVWMLTGDKIETAINIGYATSLINASGMYRVVLRPDSDILEQLVKTKREFAQIFKRNSSSDLVELPHEALGASEVAIIVDGSVLGQILTSEELKEIFGEIACMCASVICCRVTPEQKGSVVSLIRERYDRITLAIGDGANDCNMIQSAHVGVGIKGVEGMQAFNASDYGIPEFRFLGPLLIVHGRWAYRRIAKLVLYMFYKNVVIVLPSYFLNVTVSLFSGQLLFEEYLYQLFNVVFTALPVIVFAVFEQDISKTDCLEFPQLYQIGPKRVHASRRTFTQWLLTGLWHSVCIFYIPYLVMTCTQIMHIDGVPADIWMLGVYVYLCLVIVLNVKLVLESYYLNALFVASIIFSVLLWFFAVRMLEIVPVFIGSTRPGVNLSPSLAGVSERLYTSPMTFFVVFATCVFALTRDFIFKAFRFRFRARDYHIIMASAQLKAQEKRRAEELEVKTTAALQNSRNTNKTGRTKDLSVFTENDPGSLRMIMSRTKRLLSYRSSGTSSPLQVSRKGSINNRT
jgi:phospholipid-transporting ATPase